MLTFMQEQAVFNNPSSMVESKWTIDNRPSASKLNQRLRKNQIIDQLKRKNNN